MGKWLAAGALGVLALLALLLLELRAPAAAVASARPATAAHDQTSDAASRVAAIAAIAQKAAVVQASPDKLDPSSDAFFYKFDEQVPPKLTLAAAKCYEGGLHRVHRNAKVKLGYTIQITDGVLSVANVHVVESTVNDKPLEDCFAREVAKVTWTDDELPDWKQDDELVIRPERGMKKYTASNLSYEGDGPIGKLESAGDVAGSRELPR